MTIIYTDDDLAQHAKGKPINQVSMLDLDSDVRTAMGSADLVWFERHHAWGTERRMLKHRSGEFVRTVIKQWR